MWFFFAENHFADRNRIAEFIFFNWGKLKSNINYPLKHTNSIAILCKNSAFYEKFIHCLRMYYYYVYLYYNLGKKSINFCDLWIKYIQFNSTFCFIKLVLQLKINKKKSNDVVSKSRINMKSLSLFSLELAILCQPLQYNIRISLLVKRTKIAHTG